MISMKKKKFGTKRTRNFFSLIARLQHGHKKDIL